MLSTHDARTQSGPVAGASRKIRILIVDDSVVIRRLLTRMLSEEVDFDVVGTAHSATIALQKIPQLQPDVVTLDIQMPGMGGLELLPILHEQFPSLRVVIFSSMSSDRIQHCMDALMQGAADYLMKPSHDASLEQSSTQFRQEMVRKIRQFRKPAAARDLLSRRNTCAQMSSSGMQIAAPLLKKKEILAIGVSTGGPAALTTLFQELPRSFPLPIVIVQHMPPSFTNLLAKRIQSVTGFHVVEATEGMLVEPGKAIVAAGDFHMRLARVRNQVIVRLDKGEHECSCRPSVDVLFRSVHEVYGGAVIAAILTGMGQDGLRGSRDLVRDGAYLIAQDAASSVVWGMPGAVAQAGLTAEVLDIHRIADAIVQQSRKG